MLFKMTTYDVRSSVLFFFPLLKFDEIWLDAHFKLRYETEQKKVMVWIMITKSRTNGLLWVNFYYYEIDWIVRTAVWAELRVATQCTSWTLTKHMEKKLDGSYTRMLRAVLNKSWRQHPTKQQLYSYLLPITKTIQVRWIRNAGFCWRRKDEFRSDILL